MNEKIWISFAGWPTLWGRLWRWLLAHLCVVTVACIVFCHGWRDVVWSPAVAALSLIFGPYAFAETLAGYGAAILFYIVHLSLLILYLLSTKVLLRRLVFCLLLAESFFSVLCFCVMVLRFC